MNARERVLAVLNREKPDRVPVDIWLVPELVEKFKKKLGVTDELDIYRKLDVDKIAWLGIPYKGVVLKDPNEHQKVNHWGVKFKKVDANEYSHYGEDGDEEHALGEDAGGHEIQVAEVAGGEGAHLGEDLAEDQQPEGGLDGAGEQLHRVMAQLAGVDFHDYESLVDEVPERSHHPSPAFALLGAGVIFP